MKLSVHWITVLYNARQTVMSDGRRLLQWSVAAKTLLAIASFTFSASAADLIFKNRGKEVRKLSEISIPKLVPLTDVTVWEPHENKEVVYRGYSINALLEAVDKKGWKEAEEVLFTCADGYQPSLPVSRFIEHKAYLAVSRKDKEIFKLTDRFEHKQINLGPYYLVWDNRNSAALKSEGASGWPYQVVGIDLIRFADKFPHLAPPSSANAKAKRGFVPFRAYCLTCHTVNGEGGTRAGVELNYPVNVTEYFNRDWLKKWIINPRAIRYTSSMPAFNQSLPEWNDKVEEIIEYLMAMKEHKSPPPTTK